MFIKWMLWALIYLSSPNIMPISTGKKWSANLKQPILPHAFNHGAHF